MKRLLIAALHRIVADFKTLKWSEVSYENFLKAVDQYDLGAPDMGDWEDGMDDYELSVNRSDFEDDKGNFDEDDYLDARTRAYQSHMKDRFDDWYYKYKNLKFPLTLYRTVCLNSMDDLRREDLGFDWTDKKDSAHCYHGHLKSGDVYYTLVSKVKRNDIDWVGTIANNMNPNFGDDEQEINLLENIKVKVVDVLENDESTGVSFVGNSGKAKPYEP